MVTHSYGKLSEGKKVASEQREIYKETTYIALLLEQIVRTAYSVIRFRRVLIFYFRRDFDIL